MTGVDWASQQLAAPKGRAVGQCHVCHAFRLDGKPPTVHRQGCTEGSDGSQLDVIRERQWTAPRRCPVPDHGQPQISTEAVEVFMAALAHTFGNNEANPRWYGRIRAGLAAAYPVLAAQWQAEVERLRARIHEAVDECQRRHAKYVARCADFDRRCGRARKRFEEAGEPVNGYDYWQMTSEANRLVIMSILAERDTAAVDATARWKRELGALLDQIEADTAAWERDHNPDCDCAVASATRSTVARIRPLTNPGDHAEVSR